MVYVVVAAFYSSLRTFFCPGEATYFGLKPFLGSTPSCDFGRSRTWPINALTMKLEFRYFWIVFTFVGDSTTTSDRFATTFSLRVRRPRPNAVPQAAGPIRPARGDRKRLV